MMKLTVSQHELKRVLASANTCVSKMSTIPVLSCVRLTAGGSEIGALYAECTDLERSISEWTDAEVEEPGTAIVNAEKLTRLVGTFRDKQVSLKLDEDGLRVECGKVKLCLPTVDPSEWVEDMEVEEVGSVKLPGDIWPAIRQCAPAICTEQTRGIICGLLLQVTESKLTVVATDGRRLHLCWIDGEFPELPEIVLPAASLSPLLKAFDGDQDVTMEVSESRATFRGGHTLYQTRLIEGTYPRYEQTIPKSWAGKMEVNREQLLDGLRRAQIIIDMATGVGFAASLVGLELSATTPESGTQTSIVEGEGDIWEGKVQPTFAVQGMPGGDSERVTFCHNNDPYKPVAYTSENYIGLMMPLRK